MKELRRETYHVNHPSRITFGDPYYFEQFRGDKLRRLTYDLKVPDWMEARLVLREDLMEREDYGDDDLFARFSEDELKRRALVIYLAPSDTMQTYLDGMQYEAQKSKEKQIGVDTAYYLLRVDGRTKTVHTAADGYWGCTEGNMQIRLSNPARPETEGVTLPFPIPDAEYEKCLELLASIGLGDVTEQDCRVEAIFQDSPALNCLIGTSVNVDELNVLARILNNIEIDGELEKFEAMTEIRGYSRIEDLINLSLCCQNIGIITDFSRLKEAGEDYAVRNKGSVPPEALEGDDGEAVLKSLIAAGKGRITRYGVVFDGGLQVEPVYQGKDLPTVGDKAILAEATLTPTTAPQDRGELRLLLPMPEKMLERMLARAGFETNDDFTAELSYMELPRKSTRSSSDSRRRCATSTGSAVPWSRWAASRRKSSPPQCCWRSRSMRQKSRSLPSILNCSTM